MNRNYIYDNKLINMSNSSNQQFHYCFKFILVGNSSVGKSCLLNQYIEGQFKGNLDATVGVEFGQKDVVYKDKVIRVNIWDTVQMHSLYRQAKNHFVL